MNLPEDFIKSLATDIGTAETQALAAALDTPAPTSIRFNPFKVGEKPEGSRVPWSRYGFYLDERPLFTADPLLHAGVYYVQEAGSMFLEQVFDQCFAGEQKLKVLDMCAAPGGKTTHVSSLVGLEGIVVANEIVRQRAGVLCENVQKWGLGNTVVTACDPSNFAAMAGFFDAVIVDAPCSGEGMFRKNPQSRAEWSPNNVNLCTARQQRILADAWAALKEGGIMIYSTCTFNRRENEDNVAWLAREFDCESVRLEIPDDWAVARGEESGIETFRFYPHKTRSEGFFAAVVRKSGAQDKKRAAKCRRMAVVDLPKKDLGIVAPWFTQREFMRFGLVGDRRVFGYYEECYAHINFLAEHLPVIYSGVEAGQIMGAKLRPEHSLALFHDVSYEITNLADLDLLQALRYLRKEELPAEIFDEGVNLVCYNTVPIGFIKRIGGRCNNMYPKDWRILNV